MKKLINDLLKEYKENGAIRLSTYEKILNSKDKNLIRLLGDNRCLVEKANNLLQTRYSKI